MRFGAPPERWRAATPPEPWAGAADATRPGTMAPQILRERRLFNVEPPPQSEDCLFLNVWTPAIDDGRRPVMVWIHGGGFTGGTGASEVYDGKSLASRGDVVVVTVNYRLGPLGFLRLNELTRGAIPSTGNEGMLDQVLALQWVQESIANFGGDRENVTIFGESAGGMSVGCHLAMPASRPLFHKAIAQSGACHNAQPAARANAVAEQLLATLEIDPADADALLNISTEALLQGFGKYLDARGEGSIGGMPFQPVVDGAVIPEHPVQCIRNGSAEMKPVLAGATAEEWKLFLSMNPAEGILDEDSLLRRLGRSVPAGRLDHVIDVYTEGLNDREMNATPAELFSAINTDRVFR
ncbi:MAG: carboxylesterase family protein, partial [Gammaproteobacteria bacterium]